jgi:hypothetical protein
METQGAAKGSLRVWFTNVLVVVLVSRLTNRLL